MRKRFISIILCFCMILVLSSCGKSEATQAAEELINSIGTVSLGSLDAIQAAEDAVSNLSEEDLRHLDGKEILENARITYNDLLVAHVEELIAAIGTVSISTKCEEAISLARDEYEALEDSLKSKVENFEVLTSAENSLCDLRVQKVQDLIASIGDVTLDKKELIDKAHDAYSALPKDVKDKVNNYSVLSDARVTILNLTAEANRQQRLEEERVYKAALNNFELETDKIDGITWYYHTTMPDYIDIRSYVLPYIGARSSYSWICIRYNYTGDDWIFFEDVTVWIDGTIYEKEFDYYDITRDNDGGEVWEYTDVVVEGWDIDDNLEMLREIADSDETIVRFEGDDYQYDLTVSAKDKAAIRDVLTVYDYLNNNY